MIANRLSDTALRFQGVGPWLGARLRRKQGVGEIAGGVRRAMTAGVEQVAEDQAWVKEEHKLEQLARLRNAEEASVASHAAAATLPDDGDATVRKRSVGAKECTFGLLRSGFTLPGCLSGALNFEG